MKQSDIKGISKYLKVDSTCITIRDFLISYVNSGSPEIYHTELLEFVRLEEEEQKMFLANLKKVFSGNLGEKLFEVTLDTEPDNAAQGILESNLKSPSNQFLEAMNSLVNRNFVDDDGLKEDRVFIFARIQYFKPGKKDEDAGLKQEMILGTVNKTARPKKGILFDHKERNIYSTLELNTMLQLTTPIQGFSYPTITDTTVNHEQILYYTNKKNLPDRSYLKTNLDAKLKNLETTDSENYLFKEVLSKALEGKTSTQSLSDIYYRIQALVDSHDDPQEEAVIDYRDLSTILRQSGYEETDPTFIRAIYEDVTGEPKHEFKAETILMTRNFEIYASSVKLNVDAEDFQKVKQVQQPNGKLALVIEIDNEVKVNGLNIESTPSEDAKIDENKE